MFDPCVGLSAMYIYSLDSPWKYHKQIYICTKATILQLIRDRGATQQQQRYNQQTQEEQPFIR